MEYVIEFLFELIFEGCLEAVGEKKVPLIIRILCAAVLLLVFGGIAGILLYTSIVDESGVLLAFTVFFILLIVFTLIYRINKIKKKRGKNEGDYN